MVKFSWKVSCSFDEPLFLINWQTKRHLACAALTFLAEHCRHFLLPCFIFFFPEESIWKSLHPCVFDQLCHEIDARVCLLLPLESFVSSHTKSPFQFDFSLHSFRCSITAIRPPRDLLSVQCLPDFFCHTFSLNSFLPFLALLRSIFLPNSILLPTHTLVCVFHFGHSSSFRCNSSRLFAFRPENLIATTHTHTLSSSSWLFSKDDFRSQTD